MVARHVEPPMTREGVDAAGRGDQRDGRKSEGFRLSEAGPTRHRTPQPWPWRIVGGSIAGSRPLTKHLSRGCRPADRMTRRSKFSRMSIACPRECRRDVRLSLRLRARSLISQLGAFGPSYRLESGPHPESNLPGRTPLTRCPTCTRADHKRVVSQRVRVRYNEQRRTQREPGNGRSISPPLGSFCSE